jgi:2-polyprenyl-6-methoxyphenol hydroxylase-like FAD-dependent oxidoreductase
VILFRHRWNDFGIFLKRKASAMRASTTTGGCKSMSNSPQVLIVGAGPVGLGAAIELGLRGVRCLVVERNDRVGYAPRAKTTNVRTCEHLRRWGVIEAFRAAAPFGTDYPSDIVFCTRLAGFPITRFRNAFYCAPGRNPLYAEHAQWTPQYVLEEILRARLAAIPGVETRFGVTFDSCEQDERGVTSTIRDAGGAVQRVESQFVIGADGSRSRVREAIGATLEGVRGISRHCNIVVRAPGLAAAHAQGMAVQYWQVNADVPSVLGPMDSGDRWFFGQTATPDGAATPDEVPALIRRATGIDLDYQVLSSDDWVASRLIADRYGDRRIFLAGDACHLHPPFGGYGMNMGIADAVDLGWKLAAVLQGWGGDALLDSYEVERRPVHLQVMDEAVANHSILSQHLLGDGIEDAGERGERARGAAGRRIQAAKLREFDTLGIVLGTRYEGSPVILADGSAPPPQHFRDYVPSSHPGCRAPHAWLADEDSLFDHFGTGFTLLASRDADDAAIAALAAAARRSQTPLTVVRRHEAEIAELYPARYTLIRPDQHVAWRGDGWRGDGAAIFRTIAGSHGPAAATRV